MPGLLTTGHKDAQRQFPFYFPRSFNVAPNTTSESRWPPQTSSLLQSQVICCFIMKINHPSAPLAFYHLNSWNSFSTQENKAARRKGRKSAAEPHTLLVRAKSQTPAFFSAASAAQPSRGGYIRQPHLRTICHSAEELVTANMFVWPGLAFDPRHLVHVFLGPRLCSDPEIEPEFLMTELFVLRTNSLLQGEREGTKPLSVSHFGAVSAH